MKTINDLDSWLKEQFGRHVNIKIVNTIVDNNNYLEIRLSKSYDYPEVNFKFLKQLSEIVGSDEINDERFSMSGCETCDYGSNYEITLSIKNHKLHN